MTRRRFEWILALLIVAIFAASMSGVIRAFNGKDTLYYVTEFIDKAHFVVFIFYAFLFFISIGLFFLFYSVLQTIKKPHKGDIEKEWKLGVFRIWKVGGGSFYVGVSEIGLLLYLWNFGRNNADGDFEWWEWNGFNPVKRWWKRTMAKHIINLSGNTGRDSVILHLGCGSSPLINRFHCVNIGVDKNKDKIEFLRSRTDAELCVDDILYWEYPKSDVIICSEALEYLARGQEDIVLEKISGALNDGGRAIVTFPNSNNGFCGVVERIMHRKEREVHGTDAFNPLDKKYLEDLAERHGLRIASERRLLNLDCAYLLVRSGDN